MQKINFISEIVSEILKFKNPAIWLAENILAYKLRNAFSRHGFFTESYSHLWDITWSTKSNSTMKIWLWHFLVYMAKYPHGKKNENIHWVDPEKNVTDRQAGRQRDRQNDRQTDRKMD